jgi:hypothetical protein
LCAPPRIVNQYHAPYPLLELRAMTLIQTIATEEITILVADRRMTNPSTGTIADDNHTKLVCWNMSYGIGFTGLARINPAQTKSTSEWIAETICDYPDFMPGVQALCWHLRKQMKKTAEMVA